MKLSNQRIYFGKEQKKKEKKRGPGKLFYSDNSDCYRMSRALYICLFEQKVNLIDDLVCLAPLKKPFRAATWLS